MHVQIFRMNKMACECQIFPGIVECFLQVKWASKWACVGQICVECCLSLGCSRRATRCDVATMFDKQEQRWWSERRGSDEGGERRSSSSMQGMRNCGTGLAGWLAGWLAPAATSLRRLKVPNHKAKDRSMSVQERRMADVTGNWKRAFVGNGGTAPLILNLSTKWQWSPAR
jgi:hypothetical protein